MLWTCKGFRTGSMAFSFCLSSLYLSFSKCFPFLSVSSFFSLLSSLFFLALSRYGYPGMHNIVHCVYCDNLHPDSVSRCLRLCVCLCLYASLFLFRFLLLFLFLLSFSFLTARTQRFTVGLTEGFTARFTE